MTTGASSSPAAGNLMLPTIIIGIGLSGFFDGILLHQVLQWHHLLSLVPGSAFQDLGTQILADGLFHVLMYLVTAAGLLLLWRRRSALTHVATGRNDVLGGALLGFGSWNIVDVGFFHWILGIHRLRIDVADPLLYDLGWLVALGVLPIVLGCRLSRRGPGGGAATAALMLACLTAIGAVLGAQPQPNAKTALVYFAPGTSLSRAINTAVSAQAPIVWMDRKGRMIAVSLEDAATSKRLYAAGAFLVTRSPAIAGCGAALAV